MARKPFIAGNWKMHGSQVQVTDLMKGILAQSTVGQSIDVVVLPTFVHLAKVIELAKGSAVQVGAQNLYMGVQGAFTGEVSGPMLKELGCRYVLVGHSERRTLFKEDLSTVAAKFKAALAAELCPILCIGETHAEREQGQTERVLHDQITSVITEAGINSFNQAIIAYEPVWAIGTGLTATPELAQSAHAYIRQLIAQNNVDLAKTIRILYGGSMKADNAAALLAMPDIDGGLIGGAALDPKSFLAICDAACHRLETAGAHF